SPDRIVVLYANGVRSGDPARANVRQRAGGPLLQAEDATGRDVLRVSGANADAVAAQLRSLPAVRDAYADRVASIDLIVNDPLLGSEYGLAKIQAPPAWDVSQGAGVKVAVLDCGVHGSHPDLSGK